MIPALTGPQLAAIRASTVRLVYFIELELASATVRACSAVRDVQWNGHAWGGLGALVYIERIEETTSLEAVSARIGMTGVPVAWRSLALQESIRGRTGRVWVGLFDENETLIGTPTLEYEGVLDAPQIQTSAPDATGMQTADISITIEGTLADWARGGRARRHTDADQQQMYPGDLFYSNADAISKEIFPWGVPK